MTGLINTAHKMSILKIRDFLANSLENSAFSYSTLTRGSAKPRLPVFMELIGFVELLIKPLSVVIKIEISNC